MDAQTEETEEGERERAFRTCDSLSCGLWLRKLFFPACSACSEFVMSERKQKSRRRSVRGGDDE